MFKLFKYPKYKIQVNEDKTMFRPVWKVGIFDSYSPIEVYNEKGYIWFTSFFEAQQYIEQHHKDFRKRNPTWSEFVDL